MARLLGIAEKSFPVFGPKVGLAKTGAAQFVITAGKWGSLGSKIARQEEVSAAANWVKASETLPSL